MKHLHKINELIKENTKYRKLKCVAFVDYGKASDSV